ncbi:hypothetical protein ACLI1L_001877 [Corynebacterium sp. LaCa117]|uniref:hypothetical protein n=1 Tax=Corynebacterium sp. LaCa117 TaxID=3391424 RepID=UPI00398A484F
MGSDRISQGIPLGFKGMPEVRQTLAEATINFVKPAGLNLADPDDSSQYADQVWQVGELLQTAIFAPHLLAGYGIEPIKAQNIFPVAQRAVDEVLQQLPLIEDVNEAVRWSAERLAQELPHAAQLSKVDGLYLAQWLLGILESPYAEQIDVDPVQYEESLGAEGVKELRDRAHGAYARRRLAVLSGSVEDVFRTHTDGYEQLIRALSEIGQFELADKYSEKAMLALPTEDTFHIVTFWAALCDDHFPHRSPAVHRIAFDSFPMLSTARGLFAAVGDTASELIQTRLRDKPWDLAMFQYLCLNDPERAWATASDAGIEWSLAEHLLPDLPDETIPVLMRKVEEQLENKYGRDQAYELLGKIQKVAEPTSFEEFLGRLKRKFADCPEIRSLLAGADEL